MKQEPNVPSRNYKTVAKQVDTATPVSTIELIARQLDRADDAHRRIVEEGSVVRDMRGSVIPHPAIQIELTATKLVADLLKKNQSQW